MYIATGVYRDSRPDARLPFPTLDAALQKLRDWVEADEIDDDGPMFVRYGLVIDPPIPSPHDGDEEEDGEELDAWDGPGPFRMPV